MAISTNAMLLLDQKTLQIKYRVPATEIYRLSLSPYHDNIAVFHLRDVSTMHYRFDFGIDEKRILTKKNVWTFLFQISRNWVERRAISFFKRHMSSK